MKRDFLPRQENTQTPQCNIRHYSMSVQAQSVVAIHSNGVVKTKGEATQLFINTNADDITLFFVK